MGSVNVWGADYSERVFSFTTASLTTGATTNGEFNKSYYKISQGGYAQITAESLFGSEALSTDMTINVACGTFGTWTNSKTVTLTAAFYDAANNELSSTTYTTEGLNSTQGTYRGNFTLSKPTSPNNISYLKVTFTTLNSGSTARLAGIKLTYSTAKAAPAEPIYNYWKVNGEDYGMTETTTGKPVLPAEPSQNCDGRVFVGWTTSENYSNPTTGPTDLFSTSEEAPDVTTETTFYAVFANEKLIGTQTETLTLTHESITAAGSGSSGYAKYNGTRTLMGSKGTDVDIYTNQVMPNSSKIQFQSDKGLIYNTTSLEKIKSIEITGTTAVTVKEGSSSNPSEIVTSSNGSYVLSGTNGYFSIKGESSTPKAEQIVITFEIPSPPEHTNYSTKCKVSNTLAYENQSVDLDTPFELFDAITEYNSEGNITYDFVGEHDGASISNTNGNYYFTGTKVGTYTIRASQEEDANTQAVTFDFTICVRLAKPTNLTQTVTTPTARLSWDGVKGATGYTVQMLSDDKSEVLNSYPTTNTYYDLSNLILNDYYVWGVTATNGTECCNSAQETSEFTAENAACTAWSFHYGVDGAPADEWTIQCFTQNPDNANEYFLHDFEIPDKPNYYVGLAGGWDNSYSEIANFSSDGDKNHMTFVNIQLAGWTGKPFPGVGAVGTLRIYDNSGDKNKYIAFIPDGYSVTYGIDGSQEPWTNVPFHWVDGNKWETAEVAIANSYTAEYITYTGVTKADGTVAFGDHKSFKKSLSSIYEADKEGSMAAGVHGIFRMSDAAGNWEDNFQTTFIPYYNVLYHDHEGNVTGSSEYISSEKSDEDRTIRLSFVPERDGYSFQGWAHTQVDAEAGTVKIAPNGSCKLWEPNAPLYPVWIPNPTLSVSPTELSLFEYEGQGPSDPQEITVKGANLQDDKTIRIIVLPPFEGKVSGEEGDYSDVIELTDTDDDNAIEQTISVRLKAGLEPGDYIVNNDGDAYFAQFTTFKCDPVPVKLTGKVTAKCNIVWSVNGDETLGTADYNSKPTPPADINTSISCGGKKFVGWTTANNIAEDKSIIDSIQIFETEALEAVTDLVNSTTYYAVFAKVVVEEEKYKKITSTEELESGEYLIVYEKSNQAFDSSLAELDAANNYQQVTIANEVITATDGIDAIAWTYSSSENTLKSKKEYYIGRTTQSTGNDLLANKNTKYTNTITFDNGNAIIKAQNNYALQWLNNRFRYYQSAQQAIQLYKRVGGTSTSGYTTECLTCGTPLATPDLNTPSEGDITTTSAKLSWSVVEDATSYTLTIKQDGNVVRTIVEGFTTANNTVSFTVDELTAKTEYTWEVIANNEACTSDAATGSFTTLAVTYPITINVFPTGTGTVSDIAPQEAGATVDLSALTITPDRKYKFSEWRLVSGEGASLIGSELTVGTSAITLTAVFTKDHGGPTEYRLVRDAGSLEAGDEVVIANNANDVVATNIPTDKAYLYEINATFSTDKSLVTFDEDNALIFTLNGAEGAWNLTSTDGLLGESSEKTLAWDKGVTTWSIEIAEGGNATITTEKGNPMRYNSGSPRFTTYGTGQQPVQLYRKQLKDVNLIVTASLEEFKYASGTASTAQTFTVKGENVLASEEIKLSTTGEFEISLDGETYSNSLSLTTTANSENTIYVRLKNNLAINVYSGTIVIEVRGKSQTLTLAGNVYDNTPKKVTFYNDGLLLEEISGIESNTRITPPTLPAGCAGSTFVGWSETNVLGSQTAPEYYDLAESITRDLTLYAVYEQTGKTNIYKLVTDVAELAEGDCIIITNGTEGTLDAMGEQGNDVRSVTSVSASENKIDITGLSKVQVITLTKNGEPLEDNIYYMNVGVDAWLYAANASTTNTSGNYLKTVDFSTIDGKGKFAFTNAANNSATIQASGYSYRHWLRYNYNNGNARFTCYSSGQDDVYIFRNIKTYTCVPNCMDDDVVNVVDWNKTNDKTDITVRGTVPTTAIMQVFNPSIGLYGSAQTINNFTDNGDDTFTFTISTSDLSCRDIRLEAKNGDDVLFATRFKVPIVVTTNSTTDFAGIDAATCAVCDVFVKGDNITLTHTTGEKTFQGITVNAGAKVSVENGNLNVHSLTLRSDFDAVPQLLMDGSLNVTAQEFKLIKRIDDQRYYFFSVPYDYPVANVEVDGSNGQYGTSWIAAIYDGEQRTQNGGHASNWVNQMTLTDLKAGTGYAIALKTGIGTKDLVFTFNLESTDLSADNSKTASYTVTAYGKDKEGLHYSNIGWNFVANPFLSAHDAANNDNFTMPTPSEWMKYVAIPQLGSNQTYLQHNFSDLGKPGNPEMLPFTGFFIQVAEDNNPVVFTKGSGASGIMAAPQRVKEEKPLVLGLNLTNGNYTDATSLVIGNQFTDAYEIGSDFEKMLGLEQYPQLYIHDEAYRYAFKSISEDAAARTIPLGVYLPSDSATTYTIALKEDVDMSRLQGVYLTDYTANTQVNLLDTDYSFTTATREHLTGRFALSAVLAPKTVTDLTNTESMAWSVWQDAPLHISVQGLMVGDVVRVIDATGKLVDQLTAGETTAAFDLPTAGGYCVQTIGVNGIQMKKIVVR